MKVVLFCGGLGMRLRDYSETVPKPMVTIGYRPILWHIMKYYAHFGHTDFILCLGYKADVVKHYFLNYDECVSNDFVLSNGGRDVTLLSRDINDWRISFVDTGISSTIAQRLKAVEDYLDGEEIFLANYTDGLTDLPLSEYVDYVARRGKIASFVAVNPVQSFHLIDRDKDIVTGIRHVSRSGMEMNGGYFVFRREIFQYIKNGEELVEEPFQRLIDEQQLLAYPHHGFWACMDTFKEKQLLDDLHSQGAPPWEVWRPRRPAAGIPLGA
jgi:glucose-1-phosphate cytidylyltransferase